MISEVLESLGVQIVSDNDKEIKGLCPVHMLTVGREDTHPSWYMNAVTGAWICFSCQAKGSLYSLVSLLGGDESLIERAPVEAMKRTVERWQDESETVSEVQEIVVSERAFNRNPYPPAKMQAKRDIDQATCELLNIRWNKALKFFMLPVYYFHGQLMGWQEKSTGYFNNTPKGMPRSQSLFAYPAITGGEIALVESPLDAARFHRYGMQSVAVYGSYTSAAQIEALARVATRVVVSFDNDDAGNNGAAVASRMLTNLGVDVRFFQYDVGTEGSDPGDLTVDALMFGFENATTLAPASIRSAVEANKRKRWAKKEDPDPLASLRTWAATKKRNA